jgi:N-acylglucosamine-6-phosphate 2-epimerase
LTTNVKLKKESSKWPVIGRLQDSLIVSCQASDGEPLNAPNHIKALALSVIAGGAQALRLEGEQNIATVRPTVTVPIIGLIKSKGLSDKERLNKVYITATFADAESLVHAGADIVAIDATARPRPNGEQLAELIAKIHQVCNVPVLADISTLHEAVHAEALGADLVSTTLFGYTQETAVPAEQGPALELLGELVGILKVPAILEGRVWHVEEVACAFAIGAYAVVVGSAITRPQLITARFMKAVGAKKATLD